MGRSGHKVCSIEAPDGKLTPALVREVMRIHCDGKDEHMVLPRMVYISDATELGTIYTKAELAALHDVCREYGLYLFLDGARMPAALVAEGNDLDITDFGKYCDVFYIGGTKNGLLFGEAVVITNDALKPHFRNMIKQRGGMFAKGFLFGVQFGAYFKDGLWLDTGASRGLAGAENREGCRGKGLHALRQVADESGFHRLEPRKDCRARTEFRV